MVEIKEKRVANSTYDAAGHYTFNGIVPRKETFLCEARSQVGDSSEDKYVSEVGFELVTLFGHEWDDGTEHIEDHSVSEMGKKYDGESLIHKICYLLFLVWI